MKYKTMYGIHEARMWITTIIIPTVVGIAYVNYKYPNLKYDIQNWFSDKFRSKNI